MGFQNCDHRSQFTACSHIYNVGKPNKFFAHFEQRFFYRKCFLVIKKILYIFLFDFFFKKMGGYNFSFV